MALNGKRLTLRRGDSLNAQAEMAFRLKHSDWVFCGPTTPRMRHRLGYYTPDDYYEGLIAQLVHERTTWLDVGGGRDLFPQNQPLSHILSKRCRLLVGVDPSDNIEHNAFVHQRVKCTIEDYQSEQTFDLATLRMSAEHIAQPSTAITALTQLVRPGGMVVVYTVNLWSPVALISWLVPFQLHHAFKRLLWRTEENDSFPVVYGMNTRRQLRRLFARGGFREYSFAYLDDCRIFHRFRLLSLMETGCWKALNSVGLPYPENCLLGVYHHLGSRD